VSESNIKIILVGVLLTIVAVGVFFILSGKNATNRTLPSESQNNGTESSPGDVY